jgi:hypothetical protein
MKPISKNFNYSNIKWVFPQGPYHAHKANQSLKKMMNLADIVGPKTL